MDAPSQSGTPTILLHKGDLPADVTFTGSVAVDSETQGLDLNRDRLCVVQLSGGDGVCHLVQIAKGQAEAPNLKALMEDPAVVKIFHYARFDMAALKKGLGIDCGPVYCTKIASRLVRTYTDGHGLKDVVRELVGVDLDKQQQSSDWARDTLSPAQQGYAANDVLYLHRVRAQLDAMIAREGRQELLRACLDFLPTRVALDLAGWGEVDIFRH
ncbi:MAG: ribonuclease D [Rhodospirillales bacterium CG15_BIG_FIL_POST_REV_8_21_14_020_66_15]|nr:MAG: ribonuclease D [Rhodospirillales bacterium CG15_BIG_FIL_POST_REV_8_21_14_020_66_15]